MPVRPSGSGRLNRYLATITDEELERELLSSTPKGAVDGRELHLGLDELAEADFHAVGRLIGFTEGFVRRGGSVRIAPPPRRATSDEARRLAMPTTSRTTPSLRKQRSDLARLIQDRSRASRFLQRVGFLDAARCAHLDDVPVVVEPPPELASDREPAGRRVEPSPRPDQSQLLEVASFRWLRIGDDAEFAAVVDHTTAVLTRIGVDRPLRTAVEELAQNVFEHSLHGDDAIRSPGPPHMLLGVATRQTSEGTRLEILVVDGGVGIPETLAASFRAVHGRDGNQSEVVAHAFEPSSTRKKKEQVEGSARGLAVVLRNVRNAGGEMSVRSGSGEVSLRHGELVVTDPPRPGYQPGTAFSLSIPFDVVRPRRPLGADADLIESSTLDIDSHLVRHDGRSDRLVSLVSARRPATREVTVLFIEPGCPRVDVERNLDRHVTPDATVFVASTDGRGSLLRDQIEPILAARSDVPDADVLALDGLEPLRVHGVLEPRAARGLVRAIVERFGEFLVEIIGSVVDDTPLEPRRTWSLEIAARWIEPRRLIDEPSIRVLTPMILAFGAAQQIAEAEGGDLAILDVIVTDAEFEDAGDAVAGWLGAPHVRRIRVPQEPDGALLVDEIEAASVVLTSVIHGGGATVPIVRGLLAGGRSSIAVCCFVDSRSEPDTGLLVAGHEIPVVAALTASSGPPAEAVSVLQDEALALIQRVLDGEGGDTEFYDAVARSRGALSLGHFHSENRAWMSAVIAPSAIADPTTAVGRLIVDRLAAAVRAEVDALAPGAALVLEDLAEPTLLTRHLRARLGTDSDPTTTESVTVLVDWGALTGETVVRGALAAAQRGATAVVVAVGVDRSFHGAHHLLSRSYMTIRAPAPGRLPFDAPDELEERQVGISFVSAVEFPRDHRSEVDCPLCATERSLLRVRSMPTALLNSRLRILRVRTSSEPPRSETVDSFGCTMSRGDVRRFLTWRGVVHQGTDDRTLAHGVTLRLEGRDGGLPAADLIALARNLVLNADLLRRRPWSSPRFRHALAKALGDLLVSNDSLGISSHMARQLVTVLRMASKSTFARLAGSIHTHWTSPDVREELQVALATTLRESISNLLLETVAGAVTEFQDGWSDDEIPLSLGALRSEMLRVRAWRRGDSTMRARWRDAKEMLAELPTHMGIGGPSARLPIVVANLHEASPAARDTLINSALKSLHEIERFVTLTYPSIRALVEDEIEPLVRRGAAEQLPNQEDWLATVHQLEAVLEERREGTGGGPSDLQRLVESVTFPLAVSAESKGFASLVLTASADPATAVAAVRSQVDPADCTVTGPERAGRVLFPQLALHDLVTHLVDNGSKHHRPGTPPPEIRFELLPDDEDRIHRHLRVTYRNTWSDQPANEDGGLSDLQWGGAVAAFGGMIEVLPATPDESFALDVVFQRPWGETS